MNKRAKIEAFGWEIGCWDINSQFVATKGKYSAEGSIKDGWDISIAKFDEDDEIIGKIKKITEEEFFRGGIK